ncbi:MAG TPA: hypothetical protein VNL77_00685 [Roseiflexaceae bacterium]|nr:hypothetical protein [Roseiflexaceae bacterium]
MNNRYEMDISGRLVHQQRLDEAELERLARLATGASDRKPNGRRWQERVGRVLLAWGRWMDGRAAERSRV